MWQDLVSRPGHLAFESDTLPTAPIDPAMVRGVGTSLNGMVFAFILEISTGAYCHAQRSSFSIFCSSEKIIFFVVLGVLSVM